MSAANRVFAIFELLEAILIDVPLLDLLLATAISTNSQNCISSSKRLRDRLHNEPIPVFAPLCIGKSETEDICNVDKSTPWFFRTDVDGGHVLVLQDASMRLHLHVPDEHRRCICVLDSSRTRVRSHRIAAQCTIVS